MIIFKYKIRVLYIDIFYNNNNFYINYIDYIKTYIFKIFIS